MSWPNLLAKRYEFLDVKTAVFPGLASGLSQFRFQFCPWCLIDGLGRKFLIKQDQHEAIPLMLEADTAEGCTATALVARAATLDLNLSALLICRVIAFLPDLGQGEPTKLGGHTLTKLTRDPEWLSREFIIVTRRLPGTF